MLTQLPLVENHLDSVVGKVPTAIQGEKKLASTHLHLYRGVRKEDFPDGVIVDSHAVAGVLHPTFRTTTHEALVKGVPQTRVRGPDVKPFVYGGQQVIDPGRGTSLFDKEKVFGTKYWWYFTIPKGTEVPASLHVRHTGRNDHYDAEHYQIEAACRRMPVESYKGALDNLARNAVKKLYDDARSPI